VNAATTVRAATPARRRRPRAQLRLYIGGTIVGMTVLLALLAPAVAPYDPAVQELPRRLLPPSWMGGAPDHVLGTDSLGRDTLSRLLFGARISLLVGLLAVFVQGGIGIPLGLTAGYRGKSWDMWLSRAMDIQLALPVLVLAIAILGILGPSLEKLILVLGITGWVVYARIARAASLALRETDLVTAARCIGARDVRIMARHVFPNSVTPLSVVGTQQVAAMILAEAALSYLGLGVPPPTPSWGGMVVDGRNYIASAWWISTIPGITIMFVVLGINLLGDWIADNMNPMMRRVS
jgi:peptide/nickel transport system permease protein